jgi:hypothetical protein
MSNGANLDRLVAAGAIRDPDALSEAERRVIDGLSEQEVTTLVGVRRKLSAEHRRLSAVSDADAGELEQQVKSNFIL